MPEQTPTYDFEVYDDGLAGWAWAASHEGQVIVLSTNHTDENAALKDIEVFKRKITNNER